MVPTRAMFPSGNGNKLYTSDREYSLKKNVKYIR